MNVSTINIIARFLYYTQHDSPISHEENEQPFSDETGCNSRSFNNNYLAVGLVSLRTEGDVLQH